MRCTSPETAASGPQPTYIPKKKPRVLFSGSFYVSSLGRKACILNFTVFSFHLLNFATVLPFATSVLFHFHSTHVPLIHVPLSLLCCFPWDAYVTPLTSTTGLGANESLMVGALEDAANRGL